MKQTIFYSILKDRFFKFGEVTSYFKGDDSKAIEDLIWDYKEYKEGALPEC